MVEQTSPERNRSQEKGSQVLFNKLIWVIDDVVEVTKYAKGTIYNLVYRGEIPYRKRGKKLYFIPSEILSWIKGELK